MFRFVGGVFCLAGKGTACRRSGWFGRVWNERKELSGPARYDSHVWDWWLYLGSVEGSDPLKEVGVSQWFVGINPYMGEYWS